MVAVIHGFRVCPCSGVNIDSLSFMSSPPTDVEKCLNDEGYQSDVRVLTASYVGLVTVCAATLLTRFFAARYGALPLMVTHIFFLLLVLGALALRMIDLLVLPCYFTMECGMTMVNLCANAPLMMMFTIFTMLLYHTFIIVHSIHLSFEPMLTQFGSGCPPGHSPPPGGAAAPDLRPRSRSANSWDMAQSGIPGSPALLCPDNLQALSPPRRSGCCKLHCRFWVLLWGRPHSVVKLAVVFLNGVMWLLFALGLILDSQMLVSIDFVGKQPARFEFGIYLLELPAVVFASVISVCFCISGGKLCKRLKDLRRILETEALDLDVCHSIACADTHQQSSLASPHQQSSLASPQPQGSLASPPQHSSLASPLRESHELGSASAGVGQAIHGDVGNMTSTAPASMASIRRNMSSNTMSASDLATASAARLLESVSASGIASDTRPATDSLRAAHSGHLSTASRLPSGDVTRSVRGSVASMRNRNSSRLSLSSVTASFLNFDEPHLTLPGVKLLISGVRRMLIVVGVCIAAFLFRALFLVFLTLRIHEDFPRRMWLPYLLISEVAPYSVLLLFYFLPGLQAICAGTRWRRETRAEVRAHSSSIDTGEEA